MAQAATRPDLATKPIGPPRATLPEPALKREPVFRSYRYAVYFIYGSSRIGPRGREALARLAPEAKGPDAIVRTGRTDSSGDPKKNEALARRRADAVRSAMVDHGALDSVVRPRIDIASRGDIPAGTWSAIMPKLDALRARRVHIDISKKESPRQ